MELENKRSINQYMHKRNWLVNLDINGLGLVSLLVYGTEEEVREYMKREDFYYICATDITVAHGKKLGIPVYIAPEIKKENKKNNEQQT